MKCRLLVVEVPDDVANCNPRTITKLLTEVWICKVHELPTAEELGWIARNAYCNERDYPTGKSSPEHILSIGQAILDALPKEHK